MPCLRVLGGNFEKPLSYLKLAPLRISLVAKFCAKNKHS